MYTYTPTHPLQRNKMAPRDTQTNLNKNDRVKNPILGSLTLFKKIRNLLHTPSSEGQFYGSSFSSVLVLALQIGTESVRGWHCIAAYNRVTQIYL